VTGVALASAITGGAGTVGLQTGTLDALAGVAIERVIGMAVLSLIVSAVVAAVYRAMTDESIPRVYPLVLGVGAAGVWLNTASALVAVLGQEPSVLDGAVTNTVALAGAGVGALGGARAGDALAPDVLALTGRRDLDREVSRVVRTVGRFTTVTIPKRIEDIEGDEPVDPAKKEELAGRELVFPRGLTVGQLRERLADRIKRDYGIGRVDVEITDEGEITHLAVGRRMGGIGATLPPRTAAVAVDGDPGFDASPDDRVHVWERRDGGAERVATADVRAVKEDTVTLALGSDLARRIDQSRAHRLVTLPSRERPDREFAALLRAANETMEAIALEAGAPLTGLPVGALEPPVVALRRGRSTTTLPSGDRKLTAGDVIYVVGREDELRRLRTAARAS
jgi:hypothetical protein